MISVTIPAGYSTASVRGQVWQHDRGQSLAVSGLSGLPETVPVHFAAEGAAEAEVRLGTCSDGVLTVPIPDAMFRAETFWAYIFETDGDSGETLCGIKVILKQRPEPSDEVTPDEESAVDQLVAELNALITAVGEINSTAAESADQARESEEAAGTSAVSASQALSDLLAMLGTDIATLVGGKIPMSQIPATATQEIYTVTSESQLTGLAAQRGDLAELIEPVSGVQTVTKTWQLLGDDPTAEANWVVWGTSYAVQAGNAATAAEAVNATMVNNHRVVTMTQAQYDVAVIDAETIYLVG